MKLLTVPEIAKMLKISRIAVFKKVKRKEISAVKVGKTWVITEEEAKKYIDFYNNKDKKTNISHKKQAIKHSKQKTKEAEKEKKEIILERDSNKEISDMGWD